MTANASTSLTGALAQPPAESIGRRAVRASAWTLFEKFGMQAIRFAGNVVLAALLSPQAFGLMGLINAVRGVLAQISDIGIAPSIVQSKHGDQPEYLQTAWTLQIARGLVLGVLTMAMAWPLAFLIPQQPQPILLAMTPVAGLLTIIAGFRSINLLRVSRHMELKRAAQIQVASNLVGMIAMIGLAVVWRSPWVLLVGAGVSGLLHLILTHRMLEGVPNRLRWDPDAARHIWRFGKWVMLSSALTVLAVRSDMFIFGKLMSIEMLGVYSIAMSLAQMPSQTILPLGNKVVFPALCRALDAGKPLQHSVTRTKRPVLAAAGLASSMVIVAGPWLIALAYDHRYAAAQWMLPMLALAGWFRVLTSTNGSALLAVGKPRSIATGNVIKLVAMALLIPLGYLWEGVLGAVLGLVLSDVPKWIWSAFALSTHGVRPWTSDLMATLVMALGAAAVALVSLELAARVEHPILGEVVGLATAALLLASLWGPLTLLAFRRVKHAAPDRPHSTEAEIQTPDPENPTHDNTHTENHNDNNNPARDDQARDDQDHDDHDHDDHDHDHDHGDPHDASSRPQSHPPA